MSDLKSKVGEKFHVGYGRVTVLRGVNGSLYFNAILYHLESPLFCLRP